MAPTSASSYELISTASDDNNLLIREQLAAPTSDSDTSVREREVPLRSFWLLGLLNNTPYVVMLASAKNISEGGTALVFIANCVPSLLTKLSAPYWFDRVSYKTRMMIATTSMLLASLVTSHFSSLAPYYPGSKSILIGELFGVALVSLQCGLGEASLLALAGKYDKDSGPTITSGRCLTAFSSGTGCAGPFGYLWKIALTSWLWSPLSLSQTLLSVVVLAILYGAVFLKTFVWNTRDSSAAGDIVIQDCVDENETMERSEEVSKPPGFQIQSTTFHEYQQDDMTIREDNHLVMNEAEDEGSIAVDMTLRERFAFVMALWPYMIPLFTVYAAEYACQAGAWTAIGFPVEDSSSRATFYLQSNWLYQIGVLISRSSGTLFTVNMLGLWLMPGLQCINLIFFCSIAAHPSSMLATRPVLLFGSFYTGLLGGAVYVHGYKRIVADFPSTSAAELALASTSVSEGLGVLVADISGLFIQSCLYAANGLSGAVVECIL